MNTEVKDWINPVTTASDFRLWCERKWQEHLAEAEAYSEVVDYTREVYFGRHKYWLKAEFKRTRNEDV